MDMFFPESHAELTFIGETFRTDNLAHLGYLGESNDLNVMLHSDYTSGVGITNFTHNRDGSGFFENILVNSGSGISCYLWNKRGRFMYSKTAAETCPQASPICKAKMSELL